MGVFAETVPPSFRPWPELPLVPPLWCPDHELYLHAAVPEATEDAGPPVMKPRASFLLGSVGHRFASRLGRGHLLYLPAHPQP